MSGEPKALTLTLEEAMCLLYSEGWRLVAVPAWRRTTAHSWELEIKTDWWEGFATWPEAVSFALGVPVVARDEAAEAKPIGWDDVADEDVMAALVKVQTEANVLKRAVREWVAADAAYSEWMVLPVREDWTSGEAKARKERLEVAEAELRRLAGGEAS